MPYIGLTRNQIEVRLQVDFQTRLHLPNGTNISYFIKILKYLPICISKKMLTIILMLKAPEKWTKLYNYVLVIFF